MSAGNMTMARRRVVKAIQLLCEAASFLRDEGLEQHARQMDSAGHEAATALSLAEAKSEGRE